MQICRSRHIMIMEIIFYEDEKGEKPAKLFIERLSNKDKVKVVHSIEKLSAIGNELRRPNSAYLRNDILELRIPGKDNQLRILYFFFSGNKAVLSHGFIKKTMKVPNNEIDLAIKHKEDYERRYHNEF